MAQLPSVTDTAKSIKGIQDAGKKLSSLGSVWQDIRLISKHSDILTGPTYNAGTILLGGVFVLDILTLILGLLGVGEVLDTIIDFFEAWILPLPYYLVGLKFDPATYLGAAILELIPFVDLLPIWTLQCGYTLYSEWLPQAEAEEERLMAEAESEKRRRIMIRQNDTGAVEDEESGLPSSEEGVASSRTPGMAAGDGVRANTPASERENGKPQGRVGYEFRRSSGSRIDSEDPSERSRILGQEIRAAQERSGINFRRSGAREEKKDISS